MSDSWDHHYRDEQDAAYLYDQLAAIERNADRRHLFSKLAAVERKHVDLWALLYRENGRSVPAHRPSLRTRALVWVARRFGANAILPMIVAEEGREVESYLGIARRADQKRTQETARGIAIESAAHAQELSSLLGREGEPWHTPGAGGYLRSVVYGFNDGLTANFGLVAGVIGASVPPHIVIITGIAGAFADALSMGASGYLAAKSQDEVQAHQIDMEKHEITMMPEVEEEELALIYETRGMPAERARELARQVMQDPTQALDAKVREELNITAADISPLADGVVTGAATAVGAFIPILPFLLVSAGLAAWLSLSISMLAHFAIGAARSLFTGRSLWASGRDMFVVGFGVAAVGYVIGDLIVKFF